MDIEAKSSPPDRKSEVVKEVKKQLWLAGPLIGVSLLQFCLPLISLIYVGHLGELAFSGASLGSSFTLVTGFSLLLGMACAMDTLSGQSYGAGNHHMLGIHMQRAMIILSFVSLLIALIWANTRLILISIGQDHAISAYAQIYTWFMIPSIFAYGLLQCLVKFLQTQNNVFPMMISAGITAVFHAILCWALVFKTDLGVKGAGLVNSVSYWVNVLLLVIYVKFSPSCAKTWGGFSKEAFHDILTFLKLAVPSAVMVCLEIWSFEGMLFLSGLLPNPVLQTSTLAICLNTSAVLWMIPFGLGNAVSTRVSNELGAGCSSAAKLAVSIGIVIGITEAILVAVFLISIRNIWGYTFTDQAQVAKYVTVMMPFLAAVCFMDAIQTVLSGNLRGCGKQNVGAFINLGSYYLVGVPLAAILAFVLHFDTKGLWLGLISGGIVQLVSIVTTTICINWTQEAKNATKRGNDTNTSVA